VVRIYGAVKDITERKGMEAQIQAAQTRLAQSARLAAIGELASGVAHHINNPLTTIIAEAQILLQNLPDGHAGRESAEAVEQAGWRVQKAVQQLLDFSRPAAGSLEPIDINETLASARDLVQDQILSAGVALEIEACQGLPLLWGNRRQLTDLWVNLLMLACDAVYDHPAADDCRPDPMIRVRPAMAGEAAVQVEVCIEGQLIPAEELAGLFEPNFSKPPGGRTSGIELTICQEIVRQHHGQIKALSDPQAGTAFFVLFPLEVDSDRSQHIGD
jgi:two-component system NtrC family sensor kinase